MAMRNRKQQEPESFGMREFSKMFGFSDSWAYTERKSGRLKTFRNEESEERVSADEFHRFLGMKVMQRELQAEKHAGEHFDEQDSDEELVIEYDLITRQTLKRLGSREGGLVSQTRQTPEEIAARFKRGQQRKWEDEADPTGELRKANPGLVAKRVDRLQRAQLMKATAASVRSRARQRAQKAQEQQQAEEEAEQEEE